MLDNKQIKIKIITPQNWKDWKLIRLQALKQNPLAYGRTYDEVLTCSPAKFKKELSDNVVLIAYIDNQPIGSLAVEKTTLKKLSHRVYLYAVHVKFEYRNYGIGTKLFEVLFEYAKNNNITRIYLSVVTICDKAISFYKKNGFKKCGMAPGEMFENGIYYNVLLMYRKV